MLLTIVTSMAYRRVQSDGNELINGFQFRSVQYCRYEPALRVAVAACRRLSTTFCRSCRAWCSAWRGAPCSVCSTSLPSGWPSHSSPSTACCCGLFRCPYVPPCAVCSTPCSSPRRIRYVTCHCDASSNQLCRRRTAPSSVTSSTSSSCSSSSQHLAHLSSGSDMSNYTANTWILNEGKR